MDRKNSLKSLQHLFIILVTLEYTSAEYLTFARCPPPDYPMYGDYGPKQESYLPGDTIHYFCNNYYHLAGNDYRICQDTGSWSGYTAICDFPVLFCEISQTSTADPVEENEAELAGDGGRETCSSTRAEAGSEWVGKFPEISRVPRIKLFMPKGDAHYEVFVGREDGSEFSCGGEIRTFVERYEWSSFHYCPEPNDTNMSYMKIKSKSADIPIRLCEVDAHVIPEPWCYDPFFFVDNGRLLISRNTATLECAPGFKRSRDTELQCVRTQLWNSKPLYCYTTEREVEVLPQNQVERPTGERLE